MQCCISFESYIKPQPAKSLCLMKSVVYLLNPTSNHNTCITLLAEPTVVYLLNPTSNHNRLRLFLLHDRLYIFWILHQTTTCPYNPTSGHPLYIFWILHQTTTIWLLLIYKVSCISFESYIKPQLVPFGWRLSPVVYLLNPTSNHNCNSS